MTDVVVPSGARFHREVWAPNFSFPLRNWILTYKLNVQWNGCSMLVLDGTVPQPFCRYKNVNLRLGESNCRPETGNKLVLDAVLPDQVRREDRRDDCLAGPARTRT